jgi:von Willebrand factor type A domain
MRVPVALFALVLANAVACARDGENTARGDGGADRPSGADAPTGPAMACTTDAAIDLDPSDVDVLILFDGSESMGIGFGSGTRYSVVADVLAQLVDDYQGRIRFGFAQFPGADSLCSDSTVTGCCAGTPMVPVALYNGAAVEAALNQMLPLAGNTPTALALQFAHAYFSRLGDNVAKRYVLLATDGLPSCTLSGTLSPSPPDDGSGGISDACQDAVAQVQALGVDKIQVLVLAVGAELTGDPSGPPNCLDLMAQQGGMPQSGSGRGYYSAASPDALQSTLKQIFGGVEETSCLLDLYPPPSSTDPVAVYLDDQQIPYNPDNGWVFDPVGDAEAESRVRIVGEYCDQIHQFRFSSIQAKFGCPPSSQ